MAAGTVNTNASSAGLFENKLEKIRRWDTNVGPRPFGFYMFDTGAVAVAATQVDDANDETFFLTFSGSAKIYLKDVKVVATDMDSGANLAFDVIVENSAGTEVVLINDTTIGQAGGSIAQDMVGLPTVLPMDVTGMKLGIKVGTGAAGGALAGTIRLIGTIWVGEDFLRIV